MIEVNDISVSLGKQAVLTKVSFKVEPGKICVLVGANGAGKTTLLRAVSGEVKVDSGEIKIDGKSLGDWSIQKLARQRSVMPQHQHVPFAFSGRQIVDFGRYPYSLEESNRERSKRIEDMLSRTECLSLAQKPIIGMSGGEAQRIQFCRALVQLQQKERTNPSCLLLDEPTSSLDPKYKIKLIKQLREEAKNKTAILCVIHDLNLANAFCDEIIMLKNGAVVADGPPKKVMTRDLLKVVFDIDFDIVEDVTSNRIMVFPRVDDSY
ncbi:MAG: heme ABC transporter ATP-binding protein [Pseudobacteriovorax sp.]|nr:heme ABC transporter ATP-binding protein [Pseudobacteriovorax sp.]